MVKKRILVIDDLAIFREPISAMLEAQGFKALCAAGGKEALRLIESQLIPLDLIIVDYAMPEMDGISFLLKVNEYPQANKTPIIFLTDVADKSVVLQAYKSGASDYMLKSNFTASGLLEKVRAILKIEP